MVRARWWSLAGAQSGIKKPRRGKRVREVFLGPEIVLSGELKSCGTLVAEGIVDGSRIECREFILGSTGSCKGEVQAESAVISGRFEDRLIVRSRLLIKSGGHVRGSVQYGQVEIEPGGELQGDMVVHPASKHAAHDESATSVDYTAVDYAAAEDAATEQLTEELAESKKKHGKITLKASIGTLWRLGRSLLAIVEELEKRPRGRFYHRAIGMLPVVGMAGDYLGERSGLKRVAKRAQQWFGKQSELTART